MNLVNEKHVVLLKRGEDACQVAWLVEHWAAGNLKSYSKLVGNNVAECGFSKSGRAMQKSVVKGFSTVFRSLHEDLKILHYLALSAEIAEVQRPQGILEVFFRRTTVLFLSYVEIVVGHVI